MVWLSLFVVLLYVTYVAVRFDIRYLPPTIKEVASVLSQPPAGPQPVAFWSLPAIARAWKLPKVCSQFTTTAFCLIVSPRAENPATAAVSLFWFCPTITEICAPGAYG